MFNKEHCSPVEKDNKYSCMDDDIIKEIAKILNKNSNADIDLNKDVKSIHKDIESYLKNINIDNEVELKNINLIKKNLNTEQLNRFNDSFKPLMPKEWHDNINTWLCTTDITNVLNQYKKSDKEFFMYGPTPIDFDLKNNNNQCMVDSLCKINLKEHINNGKNKIGIIFNTDPHTDSGEHWISMYIDVKGYNLGIPSVLFFDSTGEEPPKEINDLINKIILQGKDNNVSFTYFENDIQHQKGGSECGVYSLHFIISMLEKKDFMKYIKEVKNDKYIEKFREIYFINN